MQVGNVSVVNNGVTPSFYSLNNTVRAAKKLEIEKYKQYLKEICTEVKDNKQEIAPIVIIGKHIYGNLSMKAQWFLKTETGEKSHLARKLLHDKSLELINNGRVSEYYSLQISPWTKKVYFVDPTGVATTKLPKVYNDVTHISLYSDVIGSMEKSCK